MSIEDTTLSQAEKICLEAIATSGTSHFPTNRGGVAGVENCSQDVLRKLELKGLIQLVADLWLPLEMKHRVYCVTPAGKTVLRRFGSSN